MKRDLHKLIAFVAILLLPLSLFAQEYGRVLTESFEDGIPQEWLQEKVSGDISWVVESGGDRPTGAFDGKKRVAFRNVSGKTTKAKTRLVLPVMDISKLYQPILVFAHAQDKWTDDFDTLKILYRTSSESHWTELKVYDKYMAKWTVDTVRLIAASKTYQIAFEATDNLGRGVVIDNIEIRSTPNCLTPYDLNASNISNDSATIGWLGAFDAESFDIKVDTVALTAEQLQDPTFKASICDINVSDLWNYTVKGLEAGTKYYCYIKSNCIDEASEWATYTFSTSNFLSLPYFESFDYAPTPGFVSYPKGWYLYSSASVVKPYINTQYSGSAYYMFSAHNNSNSYVLCFLGEREDNGRGQITGGAYAYAVLPQVGIDNISDLEISFSTTCYYALDSERFSLIVGVMTDPENKGSFVAVDTINVDKIHTFEEFAVSLENYKGAGKYIAFMSDFTESNRFLMDDLKVYYRPEVSKVRFDVKIPSATSIKLNFDKQYDKYDVVVATSELNSLTNIDATKVAVQTEITNGAEITGLPEATDFFIYARAKKGDKVGEWNTYPVCVRTPAKLKQLPYLVDFEFDKNDSSTFYNPYVGNRKATSKLDPEVTYLAYYYDEVPENSSINKTSTVPQRTENQMAMSLPLKYPEAYVAAIFPEMMDAKKHTCCVLFN